MYTQLSVFHLDFLSIIDAFPINKSFMIHVFVLLLNNLFYHAIDYDYNTMSGGLYG